MVGQGEEREAVLGASCRDLSLLTLVDNPWDGPLPRQQGGLGRAGPAATRVKGGVTVKEEKCKMNLFPVYDKNILKQIFVLIKNIHIKGA